MQPKKFIEKKSFSKNTSPNLEMSSPILVEKTMFRQNENILRVNEILERKRDS